MKVSVIIPVYNEGRTLPEVLRRVREAVMPAGCEKEVIVVDDGSTDGTAATLREMACAGAVRAHYAGRNQGKGAALRAGLELVTGEIVLVQDGDLEYDPADYGRLLAPILAGRAEVVYGSRFLGAGGAWPLGMARRNRLGNRVLTAAANLLYRAEIGDEATAYKAFRTAALRRIRLRCRRFEFCPEVTAKLRRLGYRIVEVPISYHPRGIAEGKKVRARDGLQALWTLLRLRFAPRRFFLRDPRTAPTWLPSPALPRSRPAARF